MSDGKHCPSCGVDIGVWPIFSAGLPNLIRCPRCKAGIYYQKQGAVVIVTLLVGLGLIAAAYFIASSFTGNQFLIVFLAVLLSVWVPFELGIAWYLRANKILASRSNSTLSAAKKDD